MEMENGSPVTSLRYKRLKFGKKFSIFNKTLLIVSGLCGILLLSQSFNLLQERTRLDPDGPGHAVQKRSVWVSSELADNFTKANSSKRADSNDSFAECSPPSIQEFPKDFFSNSQRRKGAVIVHILVSVYMFIALAFVCDDYFVASLDHICENLNLSEDVAGATFMAVGGSAPELFTSVIGLFVIGYGDVGPGTIVGSAVFNILVALGLVSFFAGQVTQLTRWPILRDSLSYSVAIAALIGAMYDGFITWYESLIMLLLYAGYITLMKFNSTVLKIIQPESVYVKEEEKNPLSNGTVDYGSTMLENGDIPAYCGSPDSYQLVTKKIRKLTWREVGMMVMLSDRFQPATRFRAACYMVTMRQDDGHEHQNESDTNQNEPADIVSKNSFKHESGHVDIKIEAGPFYPQDRSCFGMVFWIISRPIALILHFTIPDCKMEKWARWYMVTFLMSIIWIGALSYIMVWMVVIIGYTLGIPDVIMGITFLAAGSSVPDALASLIVSRQGQGDMATANSIGSNVFDILIGLALPWFFQTALLHPGSRVKVNSRGLIYSVVLLFTTVFITIISIHFNKWRLDRKTGVVFFVAYFIFIVISSLIEFNIFGFVNLPTCSLSE
ncbi:sodium/potassium/calcium exchanger 3-like [Rhopilema esculentum]|uniref:sodium/potassium/calcium exchanger 3-like n=1 Tax=Rhopilema esculentum TaxID=499914 RepID=UPI0031CE1A12